MKQALQIFLKATPGTHQIDDQVAEGDKVVTRLTAVGRHEAELPGPIPATGEEIRQTAVAVHRIESKWRKRGGWWWLCPLLIHSC